MNHIFQDMTDIFVMIYLDDILIFSNSLEDHWVHVHMSWNVFVNMIALQTREVLVHMQKIEFLGFMVTPTGISMDTAKTDVVSVWPTPTNLKAVQAFWVSQLLCRFIVGFSDIIIP